MSGRDFGERLREVFASAAAHGDDAAAARMVRDMVGTDEALTLLTARCRVLEADKEALGEAAMAVANDCQDYVDDEDGPGPREMMHAFLATLRPAIEAAFPGERPPYGDATSDVVTIYVAWGEGDREGRLSFEVRDPDGALPRGRGPGSGGRLWSRMDVLFLDNEDWNAFETDLRRRMNATIEGEGDGEFEHGWRLPPGEEDAVTKASNVARELVHRLRGLGLKVAE